MWKIIDAENVECDQARMRRILQPVLPNGSSLDANGQMISFTNHEMQRLGMQLLLDRITTGNRWVRRRANDSSVPVSGTICISSRQSTILDDSSLSFFIHAI